jgi:hypothetical protein
MKHAGTPTDDRAQPLLTGALRDRAQPLLTGTLRDRALDAVRDVALALADPAHVPARRDTAGSDASLASGHAGIALLYAYLARAERAGDPALAAAHMGGDDHAEVAMRYVDAAITAMAEQPMSAGLYAGFPGIAWVVTHVEALLAAGPGDAMAPDAPGGRDGGHASGGRDDADASGGRDDADASGGRDDADEPDDDTGDDGGGDDGAAEIDDALLGLVGMQPWPHDYDLISGLVGMGVYVLERLPRPAAQQCLEAILDRLDELAERGPDGTTWHTPPAHLPPHQLVQHPGGHYNLGLAHGVPGVIGLLGAMWAAGVARARVAPLLEQAVAWLLARALPPGLGARYGWAEGLGATPGIDATPTRSAWCYGDPGVAAALLLAGRATGNARWIEEARALALGIAARPEADAGVLDVGLCHGSAGLGHVLYRLYRATGEPALAEAARGWLVRTLDMRAPGLAPNVAGFRARGADAQGEICWEADPGLLTGAAGVALALLAGLGHVPPDWDRVLLLSCPALPG